MAVAISLLSCVVVLFHSLSLVDAENDTVYESTTTTGNCSAFGEYCSENASCYCDCLRAVMRCACDPNTQPSHGTCADCPASLWKPQAGNHSCHRGSCIKQLYYACHGTMPATDYTLFYITIAVASGCAVGFVAVAIFLCCCCISMRKQRIRRKQTIQPPTIEELDHVDEVPPVLVNQISMREAINLQQSQQLNYHQIEVNSNNENDYRLTPRVSKSLPSCSTNDAERPGEMSVYSDPGMCDDSGYLKPVRHRVEEDEDRHEYVNVKNVTLPKPKGDARVTVGQCLTPNAESAKHSITDEMDRKLYVNESEMKKIKKSLQKLTSNRNSPKIKPIPKPRSQTSTTIATLRRLDY